MKRVTFYQGSDGLVYAVRHQQPIEGDDAKAMAWLFGGAEEVEEGHLNGFFVGPRAEMVTPWAPLRWRLPTIWVLGIGWVLTASSF